MRCEIPCTAIVVVAKAARVASIRSSAEFILSLSKGSRPTRPTLAPLSKPYWVQVALLRARNPIEPEKLKVSTSGQSSGQCGSFFLCA